MITLKGIPSTDVVIDDNGGLHLPNDTNTTVYVDQDKLNAFLAEAAPHVNALSGAQSTAFDHIVGQLANPATVDKSGALAQLADFGKTVASSVLSALIVGFLV